MDRLAGSRAARGGAGVLHAGGRPRRPSAAALHHAGRPLAAAGDAGGRRSAVPRDAVRLRGPSLHEPPWRRSAGARPRVLAVDRQRPHRVGRLHADHAGGAAARAAQRAELHRQASPVGARGPARTHAQQGRNHRALLQPRALWRQSRRYPRRVARLFRQGAAAADAGGIGAAGRTAAIARGSAAGSLRRCRAFRPRSRARPAGGGGRRAGRRDRACEAGSRRGRPASDAGIGAAFGGRGDGRDAGACHSPADHPRAAAEEPRRARARAGAHARSIDLGRHPRGRQRDRRGACAGGVVRLFRHEFAPARST